MALMRWNWSVKIIVDASSYFGRVEGGLAKLQVRGKPYNAMRQHHRSRKALTHVAGSSRKIFGFHWIIALGDVCFLRQGMLVFWQHLEHKLWFCLENIFGRESEEEIESLVKSIREWRSSETISSNILPNVFRRPFRHSMTNIQMTLAPFHFI